MGGHILFSNHDNGAGIVITASPNSVLMTQRGCTAIAMDDPTFFFDCLISSNQITITNTYHTRTFSNSGFVQVIIGITNPSIAITWTIKSFEFFIDSTNYGLQFEKTVVYTPTTATGTKQSKSLIRMLPFNTRVYSSVHTPFRMAFKLSNDPAFLPDDLIYGTHTMVLSDFDALASFTNFECLFK